jgi:hypothetical protein
LKGKDEGNKVNTALLNVKKKTSLVYFTTTAQLVNEKSYKWGKEEDMGCCLKIDLIYKLI